MARFTTTATTRQTPVLNSILFPKTGCGQIYNNSYNKTDTTVLNPILSPKTWCGQIYNNSYNKTDTTVLISNYPQGMGGQIYNNEYNNNLSFPNHLNTAISSSAGYLQEWIRLAEESVLCTGQQQTSIDQLLRKTPNSTLHHISTLRTSQKLFLHSKYPLFQHRKLYHPQCTRANKIFHSNITLCHSQSTGVYTILNFNSTPCAILSVLGYIQPTVQMSHPVSSSV